MTRGKHGKRAENRQQVMNDVLAPYQRKVAAQAEEIRRLKERLRVTHQNQAAEVRRLKAERDQSVAPALVVAQREARRHREALEVHQQRAAAKTRAWESLSRKIIHHFEVGHGLTSIQALEEMYKLYGSNVLLLPPDLEMEGKPRPGETPEQHRTRIETLLRARGRKLLDYDDGETEPPTVATIRDVSVARGKLVERHG